jgi:hypothetical protein
VFLTTGGARHAAKAVCQDVALQLELFVLASQTRQFLAFSAAQHVPPWRRSARVDSRLRGPLGNARGAALELARQLCR